MLYQWVERWSRNPKVEDVSLNPAGDNNFFVVLIKIICIVVVYHIFEDGSEMELKHWLHVRPLRG